MYNVNCNSDGLYFAQSFCCSRLMLVAMCVCRFAVVKIHAAERRVHGSQAVPVKTATSSAAVIVPVELKRPAAKTRPKLWM